MYRPPRIVTIAEHEKLVHPCGRRGEELWDSNCDGCLLEQRIACLRDHFMSEDMPMNVDEDVYLRYYYDLVPVFLRMNPLKAKALSLAARLLNWYAERKGSQTRFAPPWLRQQS